MQQQQVGEAYPELLLAGSAGSGSATDSVTSATRHKMAIAVEARIISNVVKVVEIWARGRVEMKNNGGNQYLLEKRNGGATAREFVRYNE